MTAEEIYKTYQRGEKSEDYEIGMCIVSYEDDEAVRLIQKYYNCDEMTAKEVIDLHRKASAERVRAWGGFRRQKSSICSEWLLLMRQRGWKDWQSKTSQNVQPVGVQISSRCQD